MKSLSINHLSIILFFQTIKTKSLLISKSSFEISPCHSQFDCPIGSINSLHFSPNSTGALLASVHVKNTTLIKFPDIKLKIRYFLDSHDETEMSFDYKYQKLKSPVFSNVIDLPTKQGDAGWFVLLSATIPDAAKTVILGLEHIRSEKHDFSGRRIPIEVLISKPECDLPNTVNNEKFSITDNPCFLNLPINRADEATCRCKQDSYFIPPTKVNIGNMPEMMKIMWEINKDPFVLVLILNIGIVLSYVLAKFYQDKKLLHRSLILPPVSGKTGTSDPSVSSLKNYHACHHHYIITVFTGSRPFSGLNHKTTDVFIKLVGDQGVSDKTLLNFGLKTLKRSSVDCFIISTKKPVGRICGVELCLNGTSCWYFSRLSVFNSQTNKKYYISAGRWFNFGWFNNRSRKEFFMCDFQNKYVGSVYKAKNTLSEQVEYGNPFIRAFWSAGKWPGFSPTDRSCIFMITLSFTCLITAVWLDAVVINETVIHVFGSEFDVTNLKLAFQIEFFVIMPIDMLVEWVFQQYREVRTPKLSILHENECEVIEKIMVKTNRVPRRDAKRMGKLVIFSGLTQYFWHTIISR